MAPRKVMLIRHGEKLGDGGTDGIGGPNLSMLGCARAAALPSLFLPAVPSLGCTVDVANGGVATGFVQETIAHTAPRFDMPDLIFATADSNGSSRPRQTATPTAVALDKPFDCTTYSKSPAHAAQMAADFLTSTFDGRTILVFWHHGTMQTIVQGLGVATPQAWPSSTVFDRVWVIDFGTQPPGFADEPQRLLFGDGP